MNEPRSHEDLFVVVRESTDPEIGEYNITYNNGNTLHKWVQEMAAFVKSIDPVHLLSIGEPTCKSFQDFKTVSEQFYVVMLFSMALIASKPSFNANGQCNVN